jgi:hypothetical protein
LAFGQVQPEGLTLGYRPHELELVLRERRRGLVVAGQMCPDVLEHAVRRALRRLGHERLPEAIGESQDHRGEHGDGFGAAEAEKLVIRGFLAPLAVLGALGALELGQQRGIQRQFLRGKA